MPHQPAERSSDGAISVLGRTTSRWAGGSCTCWPNSGLCRRTAVGAQFRGDSHLRMTDAERERARSDPNLLRRIVSRHVKLERSGQHWTGLCPFHQEANPSFTLFQGSHFHCLGCGAHGDVFAFLMRLKASLATASLRRLAWRHLRPEAKKAQKEDWQPILPVPREAPHPGECLLQCDLLHEYFDPDDRLLLYVRRNERKSGRGKQFYPLTYGRLNGRLGWHAKAPSAPRPLYRLNALLKLCPTRRFC